MQSGVMEPRRLWSFLFLFPFQAAEGASTLGYGATLTVSVPRHSFLPMDWLACGTAGPQCCGSTFCLSGPFPLTGWGSCL